MVRRLHDDERSRPSDGPHPAGQKGCIDVNDVTEVDCARSVIYTNKTKLHRNQHAFFFFNMILFAIHITLNKSRNPNEGHGWRGALSTTQKIARGHWFRENLTPKLEKKSRQGGLPRCPDQKQVDTTSLVGKLSHVPWFPWFQTVLCFYSCSYKIL